MYTIKRFALFLAPKKVLIDWKNYIFPKSAQIEAIPPLTHDRAKIYLVPEFYNTSEAMEWLEDNYDYFFTHQLYAWCTDESLWPENRTWDMFQEWIHISFQSCVYDVMEESLEKEEW